MASVCAVQLPNTAQELSSVHEHCSVALKWLPRRGAVAALCRDVNAAPNNARTHVATVITVNKQKACSWGCTLCS